MWKIDYFECFFYYNSNFHLTHCILIDFVYRKIQCDWIKTKKNIYRCEYLNFSKQLSFHRGAPPTQIITCILTYKDCAKLCIFLYIYDINEFLMFILQSLVVHRVRTRIKAHTMRNPHQSACDQQINDVMPEGVIREGGGGSCIQIVIPANIFAYIRTHTHTNDSRLYKSFLAHTILMRART